MAAKRSRKSQDGQRKRARTQGRASQTKQNHTQKSRNQTGQRASLDALPGELLEGICQGLIRPAGSSSRENKRMLNFRLTCKSIDAKTVNFFAKSAFSQMIVLDRLMWYRRLLLISNLPRIAPHIRKIWFMTSDEMSAGDYRALQLRERSSRGLDERRNIREEMHQAELEQDTKAFYENSPIFAFMLVNILLKLTNVREFRIDSPDSIDYYQRIRRQQGSSLPSSTQWFQTLMSCFYEADVRPHTLTLPFGFRVRDGVEGVNIQALAAPAVVLDCFSELRELTIRVETKSFQWKSQSLFQPSYSTQLMFRFLRSCNLD